jgi:Predicted membrane protein (DUF2339)
VHVRAVERVSAARARVVSPAFAGGPRSVDIPPRVEVLLLIALVLACFALRRTRDYGALRQRLETLEAEVAALRGSRPVAGSEAAAETTVPSSATAGAQPPPVEDALADFAPDTIAAAAPGQAPEPIVPPDGVDLEADRGAPPPTEPPRPGVQIDWERWIGVRGAAVLGGVVLALAGLFFFRYSIERGLIPPWLRVVMGTLAGVGCLVASERTLRRSYAGTANALAGAGMVILYAAFWAAGARYGLVGGFATFVLLAAVTAAGGVLAWRHQSQVIAVIGLVGGFLAPLFASSGSDRPIGLFGYLLLLDVGMLVLARRQEWPLLALLGVLGTAAYQALWIGMRMGPERLFLGLGILAVFAATFALGAPRERARDRGWLAAQAGAVLLPFAFALHLAGRGDLPQRLWPLGGLLVLLAAAAAWLARVQAAPLVGVGAAAGTLGVLTVWTSSHVADSATSWQLALLAVLLALPFHVAVEREPEDVGWHGAAPAAVTAALGFLLFLVIASAEATDSRPWPWLVGELGLTALLLRHGGRSGRGWLQAVAAVGSALGILALELAHVDREGGLSPTAWLAVILAVAIGFQVAALRRRGEVAQAWGERAAALFALAGAVAVWPLGYDPAAMLRLGGTLTLGVLAALAATRLGDGRWLLATVLVLPGVQVATTDDTVAQIVLTILGIAVFTVWPLVAPARVRDDPWAWRAAALAGPPWLGSLISTWIAVFGDRAVGLLPLIPAAIAVGVAQRARTLWPDDQPVRTTALAWLLAVGLGFVTLAVPLQVEKSWLTIAWALEGVAVLVLWQRLDHPGLKWFGLALLATVTVRLVANPAVLAYWPRSGWRLFNWVTYTYLVPAAALLAAARILEPLELPRRRPIERRWYVIEQPLGAMAAGLAGLAVVFVWLNLAIADWFGGDAVLRLDFERLPARDLVTSIAWALYALVLLALGVRRRSGALRWGSLGLMMVTIAKVFLYDLGELQDLYRVASLLGLAVSLIVVSLAYQRFVLRRDDDARSAP